MEHAALRFRHNDAPTLGVELELMLIDPSTFDLSPVALAAQRLAAQRGLSKRVKLEITQSMIEINSSVHATHASLRNELVSIGRELEGAAAAVEAAVCGGGTHPFHRWQERRLTPTDRFQRVGQHYGYLAKQFTVFGQHVHVGCRSGDDAVGVVQRLSLFVPQIVAIAAASPFHRSTDTGFQSCRPNVIAAFPLSGRMPALRDWAEFQAFYARLERLGIVSSIKDFYWDIRPQPDLGTVEIRVPDTPLEVGSAADLAAYVQVLVEWCRRLEPLVWLDDFVYRYNRFQAARYGYEGEIIVGPLGERATIRDHLLQTLEQVRGAGRELGAADALERLRVRCIAGDSNAAWLREQYAAEPSFAHVVKQSVLRWRASLAQ